MAKVKVIVTLKPTLLDAQGRVVQAALQNLGYKNVERARVGKYVELEVEKNGKPMDDQIHEMCRKLLINPNTEDYEFEVVD